MKEKIFRLAVQFFKFGCIGVSNTAISLIVYYIVCWIEPELYLLGNTLGFLISTLNSYFWNHKFVFRQGKGEKNITVIVRTYLGYGFSLLISNVLMYLLVDVLDISEMIAPYLTFCVTIPMNFCINKFWVFGKGERERRNEESASNRDKNTEEKTDTYANSDPQQ